MIFCCDKFEKGSALNTVDDFELMGFSSLLFIYFLLHVDGPPHTFYIFNWHVDLMRINGRSTLFIRETRNVVPDGRRIRVFINEEE
jgi:hypothetical protein